ncbi:MAG: von Willebrand factor type A domain-containing protein [Candidatus Krumholzibacteria bacterium]|nr:von Willebrand factor type A domain-containing protein [Candidatus Krumholzibacteria bacterium]MDH4335677.1 von Willebrand factor type A domain-containing protein [Candidatus Krumholzibacteria bacterium]MDH5270022.1 von Willebrand factor type A domain-containing protein [Candidatus Krumholzibacteria bacterium]
MKTIIWISIMLAITLGAVFSSAKGTGRITGHVYDPATQAPVAGATVVVVGTQLTTHTGTDGAYTISNVPAGVYIVRAEKTGMPSLLQRISVNDGQTVTLDFGLVTVQDLPAVLESTTRKDEVKALERQRNSQPSMPQVPGSASVGKVKGMSCESPAMSWRSPGFESYDTITENSWLSALAKPLSTFSVDVDAASYGNVRRFITSGQLPPVDAVRIEELVNYFDYDYPDPRGKHPFSITTEVAECPWNPEHKLVHIGLQGERVAVEDLPPSNLVFLIDVSGSMNQPNKLPLLKSSFRMLVDQLRPQDRVAIVVYAGAAGLVLPSTSGSDREQILCAIDRLEAGGSTAGGAGIKLAYQVAQQNFLDDGNNRVILATDGDFNVGASSDSDMERLIEEKRKSGVFLTVLGFGEGNLKDSKMETIADKGNGHYAYIDNIVEAKKVLINEMGATLLTIAKDVKLQVEFNPARVASYRLVGYENRLLQDRDFDDDTKDAGEIGAGHSVTALYEIALADRDDRDGTPLKYSDRTVRHDSRHSDELLTVSFRYKEPTASESKLLAVAVKDRNTRFANASDNFRFAAAVAEFGMVLRNSPEKGSATMEQVIATARAARGEDVHGYRAEFVSLAETAQALMTPVYGVR